MNYLRFLRQQRGISQQQLAQMLGTAPDVLCKLERGWHQKPPGSLGHKLVQFFGVPLETLLSEVKLDMTTEFSQGGSAPRQQVDG
jgi:transcriptional regulator with XRE-family HTH domain